MHTPHPTLYARMHADTDMQHLQVLQHYHYPNFLTRSPIHRTLAQAGTTELAGKSC